ncbi:MAG: CPBP family intramembrane metalloprotease [Bacteroidetes bacterium]|nr:CPBP family intramembrane metalloprotease [Bacteroidota bacterium]MBS1740870.1 CPBP family intramembrane metalloprotease [Bacteroidota bacterium]
MRKITGIVRTYFQEHFSLLYFLPVALFTAILISLNYYLNFEEHYISYEPNDRKRFLLYCCMYLLSFGGAYVLYLFDKKSRAIVRNPKLWGLIIFTVLIFSFRWWFYQYNQLVYAHVPILYQNIVIKYIVNLSGFIWLFIPCWIYWFGVDRKQQPIYGFHAKGVVLRPYFMLVLMMIPLIMWAATQRDFLDTYPRVLHTGLAGNGWRNQLLNLGYELCYSVDFVNTEFFFRGFLILAFARFVGARAILPMCVFYVAIHFEKPLAETISSFFGGWLLGILAYETKSIYGGIIVHLGIALLMEIVALAAHMIHPI